jgi:hypothetical protein
MGGTLRESGDNERPSGGGELILGLPRFDKDEFGRVNRFDL